MLTAFRLERYAEVMDEEGYDDLRWLCDAGAAQLRAVAEGVGMKPGHARKFVDYVPLYRPQMQQVGRWPW